jgi:LPPG:FO 2-phospho-L-lactate transferase
VRDAVRAAAAPVVGVSPLIGGKAVKGPAAEMLERLAGGTAPADLAGCYPDLLDALVIDEADRGGSGAVAALGIRPHVARTLMTDRLAARGLAEAVLVAGAPG